MISDYRTLETENWQHKLGTDAIAADIEDINQCIDTICTTQKGSIPYNPEFGLPLMDFMDKPINLVASKIAVQTLETLKLQEPRATYQDCKVKEIDENGCLRLLISYTYNQTSMIREVPIPWQR